MDTPTPENVRLAMADLDTRRQKVVAGLFAVMIHDPERIRDREWIARQLTEIVVMAGEFEADTPAAGVEAVEEFLHANAEELLAAAYLLFQRVGLDLSSRTEDGFTYEEAMRLALSYLPA